MLPIESKLKYQLDYLFTNTKKINAMKMQKKKKMKKTTKIERMQENKEKEKKPTR